MYCFRFILQNMMKPLTHFFFLWVGQGALMFSLSFMGPLPPWPFLAFLPAVLSAEILWVVVHV